MDDLDSELLRKALIRYLAAHHPAAFSAASLGMAIVGRGMLDFQPDAVSVSSALLLLSDLGLVASVTSPVGSSVYHRATAAGKLAVERGEV